VGSNFEEKFAELDHFWRKICWIRHLVSLVNNAWDLLTVLILCQNAADIQTDT